MVRKIRITWCIIFYRRYSKLFPVYNQKTRNKDWKSSNKKYVNKIGNRITNIIENHMPNTMNQLQLTNYSVMINGIDIFLWLTNNQWWKNIWQDLKDSDWLRRDDWTTGCWLIILMSKRLIVWWQ